MTEIDFGFLALGQGGRPRRSAVCLQWWLGKMRCAWWWCVTTLALICVLLHVFFLLPSSFFLLNKGVFIVHHVVGIMPFLFNCFFFPNLQFLVGGGILIELANPFLNWRTAIDLWENHNTAIAAKVQVINYVVFNPASSLVTC